MEGTDTEKQCRPADLDELAMFLALGHLLFIGLEIIHITREETGFILCFVLLLWICFVDSNNVVRMETLQDVRG